MRRLIPGVSALLFVLVLGFVFLIFSSSPELVAGGPFGFLTTVRRSPDLIIVEGSLSASEEDRFYSVLDNFAASHDFRKYDDPRKDTRFYSAKNGPWLGLTSFTQIGKVSVVLNKDADNKSDYNQLVAEIEQTFVPLGLHRVVEPTK